MNRTTKILIGLIILIGLLFLIRGCGNNNKPVKVIEARIDTLYDKQDSVIVEAEKQSEQQVKKAANITKRLKKKPKPVIKDTTNQYMREYITTFNPQKFNKDSKSFRKDGTLIIY